MTNIENDKDKPSLGGSALNDGLGGALAGAPARVESLTPSAYRLGKRQDGVLVLQGAYTWHEGLSKQGYEWRDIPTVDLYAS